MACEFLGWGAIGPEAQAAWVQAVGSVLAIGAAVGIAWWQATLAKRDRHLADQERREVVEARARSLGLQIYRDLVGLVALAELVGTVPEDAATFDLTRISAAIDDDALVRMRVASAELGVASKPLQLMLFHVGVMKEAHSVLIRPPSPGRSRHPQHAEMFRESAAHVAAFGDTAQDEIMAMILRAADH